MTKAQFYKFFDKVLKEHKKASFFEVYQNSHYAIKMHVGMGINNSWFLSYYIQRINLQGNESHSEYYKRVCEIRKKYEKWYEEWKTNQTIITEPTAKDECNYERSYREDRLPGMEKAFEEDSAPV